MIFPWTKLKREIEVLKTDLAMVRTDRDFTQRALEAMRYQRNHYSNALSTIAAQEKPTSNATVKRICRMAREALK